ncbi:hypothetical protein CY0110_18232 [Crocosphaera chwakensis CCY0110]|uniref:Uncharacterized protein n=1 Tax=Crocosphaera chwakensis CCY0110 TaxID=391612 RepID=A3IIX8_9CHRO|nr:hypothetical protein CY0110_18232 [Crocosphaera chwakensis CCY0110]
MAGKLSAFGRINFGETFSANPNYFCTAIV